MKQARPKKFVDSFRSCRSVRELCELTSNNLSADAGREFVLELLDEGLLAAERDDASISQLTTQRSA
jgi:hypothetical protein